MLILRFTNVINNNNNKVVYDLSNGSVSSDLE